MDRAATGATSEQGAGDRVGIGHQGAAEADHDHGGDQAGDPEHQDRTDGDDAEHDGSGTDRDTFGRELVDRIGPADGAAGVRGQGGGADQRRGRETQDDILMVHHEGTSRISLQRILQYPIRSNPGPM